MASTDQRKTLRVVNTYEVMEGAGVLVERALPSSEVSYDDVDPFLLLDFATINPDDPGFPDHPHRGFEIVTYVLSGAASHTDSLGDRAEIPAGAAQRITAGRGMTHGEGFGEDSTEAIRGLQLWINLSKENKSVEPEYQTLLPHEIPVDRQSGLTVKQLVGGNSPMTLRTPTMYLDVTIEEGRHFERRIPQGFQGFAFVIDGEGLFGEENARASAGQLVLLGSDESFRAKQDGAGALNFVLVAGQPHREPVLWRGPFVD